MITKETVIAKMEQALQLAKQGHDEQMILEQMKKIHFLAELMMESQTTVSQQIQTTVSELKQVTQTPVEQHTVTLKNDDVPLDDGTSIFDF